MRARTARGSFLDPRTKILIWLLANVVVFTWTPAVFRIAVMLVYFGLFLLERKGKMLVGLLLVYLVIVAVQFWLLPLLPGSLATVFATVTYFTTSASSALFLGDLEIRPNYRQVLVCEHLGSPLLHWNAGGAVSGSRRGSHHRRPDRPGHVPQAL